MEKLETDFELCWKSIEKDVFRVAEPYCRGEGRGFDASDIVQETAMAAYLHNREQPFKDAKKLASWAKQRAHWICLDKFKVLHPTFSLDDTDIPTVGAQQITDLIWKDLRQVVERLLQTLPSEQRAVMLRKLKGHTDQEIAIELEKTTENVRSLAKHAKDALSFKLARLEK